MAEITRRSFLQKSGQAAVALGLAAMAVGGAAQPAKAPAPTAGEKEGSVRRTKAGGSSEKKALSVPMEVEYKPAWLTWVTATAGCLRALGITCDQVDVAGYSGYAFLINVGEGMCPSGPTAFDWGLLLPGVTALGRSALVFRGAHCCCELNQERTSAYKKRVREEMRAAYDLVATEIESGRPCVLWGTYVPEFGIAVGVQNDSYLVKTWKPYIKEPEPPIPFDKLTNPSGSYVLAFPTAVEVAREQADREALNHAVTMLNYRTSSPQYGAGQDAYDKWIACLDASKAEPHGNSYNAHCWAEARRFARDFLSRVAARNEAVAKPLGQAVVAYSQAADALGKVARLFPFPHSAKKVNDPEARAAAIEALRAAKPADARAAAALTEAAAAWPR